MLKLETIAEKIDNLWQVKAKMPILIDIKTSAQKKTPNWQPDVGEILTCKMAMHDMWIETNL